MADARRRLTNIVGGSAGNLVEWFDWYVYSAFALYFAPVFFPKGDTTAQLLNTAAVFAVGFVMRPIGAWVMGIYAVEYVALYLEQIGHERWFYIYVSVAILGSLIAYVRMRETKHSSLINDD